MSPVPLTQDGLVNVPSELLQWPPLPMQLDEKRETKDFLLPDACPYQCRAIKLENGITTMLIHDPDAEIASCSLNVAVGSLMNMDPVSGKVIEGLAHFLEHLLFLGTEKYPDEAAYNEFINENGGHSNAYTAAESTNYHFSTRPDALEKSLDMFSHFFIDPLFDKDCVDRELKAVHSEHDNNLQNNMRRTYSLVKKLNTKASHPAHHFATGNVETLRDIPDKEGIDIVAEVKKFYEQYYSANIMTLCIVSNHSLDELETLARNKFTPIENRHVVVPKDTDFNNAPYEPTPDGLAVRKELFAKKQIVQLPAVPSHSVTFSFHVPANSAKWASQGFKYCSHLIGHEGPRSLLSRLKQENLALEIIAGPFVVIAGSAIFNVTVNLPSEKPQESKIKRIGELLFSAIRQLSTSEIKDYVIKEIDFINLMQFKSSTLHKELNLATMSAASMSDRRPEVLFADYLSFYRDDLLTRSIIDCMTVENLQLRVVAPEFESDKSIKFEEDHYETTRYNVSDLPREYEDAWKLVESGNSPAAEELGIDFPEPNPFVPKDLRIRDKGDSLLFKDCSDKLDRALVNDRLRLFFKKDTHFRTPTGSCQILIRSEKIYSEARTNKRFGSMLKLLLSILDESMNEELYDAALAGYSLKYEVGGNIGITCSGYSSQLPLLCEKLVEAIMNMEPHVTEKHFDTVIKRQINNSRSTLERMENYQHSSMMINNSMLDHIILPWDYLAEIETMTYDEIVRFSKTVLASLGQFSVDMILGGNFDSDEAFSFAKKVNDAFELKGAPKSHDGASIKVWKQDIWLEDVVANWGQTNSSSCVFYPLVINHNSPNYAQVKCYLEILGMYGRQPFFDELRTKQQLGYVVYSRVNPVHDIVGLQFQVQSAVASPEYVINRIEYFMETNIPNNLSEEKFDSFRNSMVSILKEKPSSILGEMIQASIEVMSDRYMFDQKDLCISFLESEDCNLEEFKVS
eukprot:GHVH01013604.1.p1 GENE.GHVH01013604.1~~GHVH01013604.1.p1  ORF type:complete len:983 (+),score=160.19 GHVH01013604.1:46-2949(+)